MPAPKLERPAIDQLAATPDILRALLNGVSEQQALEKPAADRFSIAELLEHLSHIEGHYFRHRFDEILESEGAEFDAYNTDRLFAESIYSGREPEESMAHWEEQREGNLEFLRALEPAMLSREGHHTVLGTFTLSHLLNEWALHDLAHIRQLAELVRWLVYYPDIGPFQADYQLKP